MTHTAGRSASRVASTASTEVSATTGTDSAPSPNRSARSRTWAADSSPETYRTLPPAAARFPSAIPVSVDLPMPGEPPSRTSEPGTSPPPSTRSNSPTPVDSRGVGARATSRSGTGRTAAVAGARPRPAAPRARPAGATARSSTSVFHSPQPGHRPCQRGSAWPQLEQRKTVAGRAMGSRRLGPRADGLAPRCARPDAGRRVPAASLALDALQEGHDELEEALGLFDVRGVAGVLE